MAKPHLPHLHLTANLSTTQQMRLLLLNTSSERRAHIQSPRHLLAGAARKVLSSCSLAERGMQSLRRRTEAAHRLNGKRRTADVTALRTINIWWQHKEVNTLNGLGGMCSLDMQLQHQDRFEAEHPA